METDTVLDDQAQPPARCLRRNSQADESKADLTKSEALYFNPVNLQAQIRSNEDELVQRYREQPKGMSLSVWCT